MSALIQAIIQASYYLQLYGVLSTIQNCIGSNQLIVIVRSFDVQAVSCQNIGKHCDHC